MIDYRLIGRRIKDGRKHQNISQAKLAELTNLSVSYISYVESGKKKASLKSLVMISNALDVTVDALLGGNLKHDRDGFNEVTLLMEDCSEYEKRVLFEQMLSLKAVLRSNRGFLVGE